MARPAKPTPGPGPRDPASEVVCEPGRHIGCLHDRARAARGPGKPSPGSSR